MAEHGSIPLTYAQWRECITVKCRIKLSRNYLEDRLCSLEESESNENRNFRRLYGEAHFQAVRRWFQKALEELPAQLN
ncbi:MAG: hypothetical protein JNJ46_25225 [Myxococcales bacterium]|nr:hypothetical protein [Myxococcales bacterium]